jgi:glyoxylase-like metal-dependent hydrolase (beta-lactamase superfamily II)
MRRQLIRISALLMGALSIGALTSAQAAAPQQRTQAPGFYRMMVGDIEITALNDGTEPLPAGMLFPSLSAEAIDQMLAKNDLASPVETSFNAFLVNTGTKLVLIDTGGGALDGATLGHLVGNLRAAGYQPAQIDEVYVTHMHWDHIGGLMSGNERTFPNAVVRAGKADADYWLDAKQMAAAPKDLQDSFQHAQELITPYIKAGKFTPIEHDGVLVPGVSAYATPGHTPGHTSYLIESKGQKMIVLGDLVHVASVQFPKPALEQQYDSDPKAGAAQRVKIYAEAAAGNYWVAGAHLSFPGIGHLKADGAGYRWVPINYSTKF